jgi:ribosomal protein S18 acetylase RimI-like enzyme
MAVQIRPCRASDIPAVLEFWTRTTMATAGDNPRALRLRLKRDRAIFLLAVDGTRIVGTLMGGWDGWRGTLARLAVDPEYRRRGIAKKLVSTVEQTLRTIGVTRISCLVMSSNRRARAFWRDAGYAHDVETVRYKRDL